MALNSKQIKAVEMLVYTEKQKQEIAAELKITNGTLSQWLKKPEFQDAMKDEMHRAFNPLALKARRRLDLLIDSRNEGIALAAAREALNKAGYAEATTLDITTRTIELEIEE